MGRQFRIHGSGKWSVLLLVGGCKPVTLEVVGQDEDNFEPDHVVQVSIEMEDDAWDSLRNESRSFLTEFIGDCRSEPFQGDYTTFHADIEVDGESLSNVGIRKKGFIGSQSTSKPSLKINMDEYEAGAELFGSDNWTFNNAVQDPALIRQCIGYDLFSQAGLPAPRCNYAHVSVNGQDLGIYAHVEPIKRSFLRRHFGNDDGDLYEGTLSDFRDGWTQTFDSKTSDTDDSLAPVEALADVLESSEDLAADLEEYLDVDQLLTFLAMETVTGHWDGFSGNTNNFYVYNDPDRGTLSLIPWGLDDVLDPETIPAPPFSAALLPNRILQDSELADRLADRIQEMLDAVWDQDELLDEVDRIVDLLSAEIDMSPYEDGISGVRQYLKRRDNKLSATLPGEPGDLQDLGCLSRGGKLEATFETTWGSLAWGNLALSGTTEMTLTWGEDEVPFVQTGVGAGQDDGADLLVFYGMIDESAGSYVIPYISFEPNSIEVGEELELDHREIGGAILYTDNERGGELVTASYLFGGELIFDAFGVSEGDRISGTLNSPMYMWE